MPALQEDVAGEQVVEQDPMFAEEGQEPERTPFSESEEDSAPSIQAEEVETPLEGEAIPADWRDLAKQYGLADSQIDHFDSIEALETHLRTMDQSFAQQQAAWQPPAEQQAAAQQVTAQALIDELKLEGLDDLPSDDPARRNLEKMATFLSKQQQAFNNLLAEREQERTSIREQRESAYQQHFASEFDKALDEVDSVLFGKAGSLMGGQFNIRRNLFQQAWQVAGPAFQSGQAIDASLLTKVIAQGQYPQTFIQKQERQVTDAVRARSGKRTGAGSRGPKVDPRIPFAESPESDDAFRRLRMEFGS